jgi:hypothetical protein
MIIDSGTNRSKLSFQYGFKVFLMTEVDCVCSPLTIATANGSGKPGGGVRGLSVGAGTRQKHTENITLVQTVGGNDWSKELELLKRLNSIITYPSALNWAVETRMRRMMP